MTSFRWAQEGLPAGGDPPRSPSFLRRFSSSTYVATPAGGDPHLALVSAVSTTNSSLQEGIPSIPCSCPFRRGTLSCSHPPAGGRSPLFTSVSTPAALLPSHIRKGEEVHPLVRLLPKKTGRDSDMPPPCLPSAISRLKGTCPLVCLALARDVATMGNPDPSSAFSIILLICKVAYYKLLKCICTCMLNCIDVASSTSTQQIFWE